MDTVGQLVAAVARRLRSESEGRWMVAEATALAPARISTVLDHGVSSAVIDVTDAMVRRRLAGEPLQYILGTVVLPPPRGERRPPGPRAPSGNGTGRRGGPGRTDRAGSSAHRDDRAAGGGGPGDRFRCHRPVSGPRGGRRRRAIVTTGAVVGPHRDRGVGHRRVVVGSGAGPDQPGSTGPSPCGGRRPAHPGRRVVVRRPPAPVGRPRRSGGVQSPLCLGRRMDRSRSRGPRPRAPPCPRPRRVPGSRPSRS